MRGRGKGREGSLAGQGKGSLEVYPGAIRVAAAPLTMYITEVSKDVASPVPLSLLRAFPAAADPDPATAATVGRGHQERPTVGVIVRGRIG
jgi:hypothetical protein